MCGLCVVGLSSSTSLSIFWAGLWVLQGNSWSGSLFSPVVYRCFDFSGSWQTPGQGVVCCLVGKLCWTFAVLPWLGTVVIHGMAGLLVCSILKGSLGIGSICATLCLDRSPSPSNCWHVRYMVADLHTHYMTHRHALSLTLTRTIYAQATIGTSFVSSITAMKDDPLLLLFSVCNVLLQLYVCFFPLAFRANILFLK